MATPLTLTSTTRPSCRVPPGAMCRMPGIQSGSALIRRARARSVAGPGRGGRGSPRVSEDALGFAAQVDRHVDPLAPAVVLVLAPLEPPGRGRPGPLRCRLGDLPHPE